MNKDYYRTLGVLDDAEDIVIKAAYHALAQRYHPDRWAGGIELVKSRLQSALGFLSFHVSPSLQSLSGTLPHPRRDLLETMRSLYAAKSHQYF